MADSLRALIAETDRAHVDVLHRGWTLSCSCGAWSMSVTNETMPEVMAEFRLHRADAILAAFDGRLLPEGGEAREEWMVEINKNGEGWRVMTPYITTNRAPQPAYVADIDAYMRGIRYRKRKMQRTVHTGPDSDWASDRRRGCAPGRIDPDVFFPETGSAFADGQQLLTLLTDEKAANR